MAGEQHERTHRDPLRVQRHQERADALVLGRVGVGAGEHDDPVGEVRAGRPHLLAVDQEVIALVLRASAEAGEVGARAGLGEALRPDFLTAEDRPQVAALLLVGAPVDDRGTHQVESHRRR